MFELSVKSDFAAAHFLRGYEGKCKHLHGHTWKVEVVLGSRVLNSIGMVCDFMIVKRDLRELLEEFDHKNLNDLSYFKKYNPTTEHLAKYIFDAFSRRHKTLKVKRVTVWESDFCSVTYSP